MAILVIILTALMGLLFCYLGYCTGKSDKRITFEVRFAVLIAVVVGFAPLLVNDWTFLPFCAPWLLGLLAGKLRARIT